MAKKKITDEDILGLQEGDWFCCILRPVPKVGVVMTLQKDDKLIKGEVIEILGEMGGTAEVKIKVILVITGN